MANGRDEIHAIVQKLPDKVTLDQVAAELYFKKQVDNALKQLDEGKGIPHKQVKQRLSKWLLE